MNSSINNTNQHNKLLFQNMNLRLPSLHRLRKKSLLLFWCSWILKDWRLNGHLSFLECTDIHVYNLFMCASSCVQIICNFRSCFPSTVCLVPSFYTLVNQSIKPVISSEKLICWNFVTSALTSSTILCLWSIYGGLSH